MTLEPEPPYEPSDVRDREQDGGTREVFGKRALSASEVRSLYAEPYAMFQTRLALREPDGLRYVGMVYYAITMLADGETIQYRAGEPYGCEPDLRGAPVVQVAPSSTTVRLARPGEQPFGTIEVVSAESYVVVRRGHAGQAGERSI